MQPGIHQVLVKLTAAIICAPVGYRLFDSLLAPWSRPVTGPPTQEHQVASLADLCLNRHGGP